MELHHQYSRDDVVCISLNLDYLGISGSPPQSSREPVLEFLRSRGATFDNVLAIEECDVMLDKLGLAAPPGVYVYNRQGELSKRFDNSSIESEEEAFTYRDVGQLVARLVEDGG